ncbi:G patch domain and KOW motifs-containing protein [Pelomyxa schiedti]|nr:G patch domain and KOW motifs-containing protein [Pelomyxa schiedti]
MSNARDRGDTSRSSAAAAKPTARTTLTIKPASNRPTPTSTSTTRSTTSSSSSSRRTSGTTTATTHNRSHGHRSSSGGDDAPSEDDDEEGEDGWTRRKRRPGDREYIVSVSGGDWRAAGGASAAAAEPLVIPLSDQCAVPTHPSKRGGGGAASSCATATAAQARSDGGGGGEGGGDGQQPGGGGGDAMVGVVRGSRKPGWVPTNGGGGGGTTQNEDTPVVLVDGDGEGRGDGGEARPDAPSSSSTTSSSSELLTAHYSQLQPELPAEPVAHTETAVPLNMEAATTVAADLAEGGPHATDDTPSCIVDKAMATERPTVGVTTGLLAEMMHNRIEGLDTIENDDERFRYDVECRPDEDPESYDRVPIEAFGEAALRGMGWKPGTGLGKNHDGPVEPPEPHKHAGYRLGLGCSPEVAEKIKKLKALQKREAQMAKKGKGGSEEELERGVLVAFLNGEKMGEFAVVKESGLAGQVLVRLDNLEQGKKKVKSLGATEVWVSRDDITVVDLRQLADDHPALAFVHKVRAEKAFMNAPYMKEQRQQQQKREQQEAEQAARAAPAATKIAMGYADTKVAVTTPASATAPKPPVKTRKHNTRWVRPNLTVRVVSKSNAKVGKYYKQKALIVDVPAPNSCVLQIAGIVIEDVHPKFLETVVPAEPGARVMIVASGDTDSGRIGSLISRTADFAQVRIDMDVKKFDLDDVCLYSDPSYNGADSE